MLDSFLKFFMNLIPIALMASLISLECAISTEPLVTANKYLEYKKNNGHIVEFTPPIIVLICYQQSTLDYLLNSNLKINQSKSFSNLYLLENGKVGILGGWGVGAPALAVKMEQLIALGVKKFIAIGTAGTLMNKHPIGSYIISPKALAEDGVAHLYLTKDEITAAASEYMLSTWENFLKNHSLPNFHKACTWSFSAMFRETPADINRVTNQGYDIVEMEAASLYAIGKKKEVETISLFVISDAIDLTTWAPHFKESIVRNNLHQLAKWALDYCCESSDDVQNTEQR